MVRVSCLGIRIGEVRAGVLEGDGRRRRGIALSCIALLRPKPDADFGADDRGTICSLKEVVLFRERDRGGAMTWALEGGEGGPFLFVPLFDGTCGTLKEYVFDLGADEGGCLNFGDFGEARSIVYFLIIDA